MDNVSRKRPQQQSGNESPASITLPNRSRGGDKNVTSSDGSARREVSASSAVNARAGGTSATHSEDDEDDDDYTSSSGSSLSSDDDEDGESDDDDRVQPASAAENPTGSTLADNDGITPVPARRKPNIRRMNQEPSLLGTLSAFLPQMKTANEDLQREIDAGRAKDIQLDDVDENENDDKKDGQYIEMNLGLGVLEEKRPGDESDDEHEAKDSAGPQGSSEDTNLMDRLMGKEKTSEKPSIQDLGN